MQRFCVNNGPILFCHSYVVLVRTCIGTEFGTDTTTKKQWNNHLTEYLNAVAICYDYDIYIYTESRQWVSRLHKYGRTHTSLYKPTFASGIPNSVK